MAKKALLDVLEKTIGKYVKNLDTNSLNVAVWSGKIELNSLELDVGAVNAELDRQATVAPNLDIPLRVVDGSFTHFEVDVPWTHLMSKPVILRARGLQVSVAPMDPVASEQLAKYSEENAAERIQTARKQSIATANDYRIQTIALTKLAEEDLKGDGKNASDTGFVARLVRRIIENLQIEISDVHITLVGSECSAGVTLESMRLITTDENGNQTFVDRTKEANCAFLHKHLLLRGLGFYLDEKDSSGSHALTSIGEEDHASEEEKDLLHNYILAPLSFTARLRQADGNVCVDYPKYLLESELASLSILLSKTQVEMARKIQVQMQASDRVVKPLFPGYRPLAKVSKANAREWWWYAFRSVGRLTGKRGWVEFWKAFQLRKEYIELYKRHVHAATCSWMSPLSNKEKNRLGEIEKDRSISIEGLMTWRNIADARARKEIQKKGAQNAGKKSGLFGSLFAGSDAKKSTDDDPPIRLSPEELKELETLTLMDIEADSGELSKDSKLCDLSFILGAFTVHLTTHDSRPLSTLIMGRVSTNWNANADGSFWYNLSLSSLTIEDCITPHTLFPSILSNKPESDGSQNRDQAFKLNIEKTKTGDQRLKLKLRPFQIVASPLLLQELKSFASPKAVAGPPKSLSQTNPMLCQSLSGSVDLFYDASEGVDLSATKRDAKAAPVQSPTPAESSLSNAIFDAWKAKTEMETVWILDLDVAAPIIIIPEHCSRRSANVLVLDLGRITFRYGGIEAVPRVKNWFRDNPYPGKTVNLQYDYGALQLTSLKFVVAKAGDWNQLSDSTQSVPVLSPITASIDLGVENHSERPRLAAFLVLPVIAGELSPEQVGRIMMVSKAWQKNLSSMSGAPIPNQKEEEDELSYATNGSTSSRQALAVSKKASELLLAVRRSDADTYPMLHFAVQLQRVSARLEVEGNSGVEAHLVSVSSSITTLANGNAKLRVSMGWFWVLDRLTNNFARVQRLVAHSSLPLPASQFAQNDKYDIMHELERRGVFDENFEGSSDLADIVVRFSPGRSFGKADPFAFEGSGGDDLAVDAIVDAKFASLLVNWDPYAVKTLVSSLESFTDMLRSETYSDRGSTIIAQGESPRKRRNTDDHQDSPDGTESDLTIFVRAEFGGLELILRSALDDLPLFALSMTSIKASVAFASGITRGTKAYASVGNLEATSSGLGRTCEAYKTFLGLSPGRSESLLTVSFSDGPRAMKHVQGAEAMECYAQIQLSPMRLVYIHSQILALVDYTTQGILGAITKQAATSAAAAAAELAIATSGKKVFEVRATGIEVLAPEAAYEERCFSVSTGELSVKYDILPHPGGGEAKISLSGMMLHDSQHEKLLCQPCELGLDVFLPPDGVGSPDDQALRVQISMSDADFAIARAQYIQILALLQRNIGDAKLYLRTEERELGRTGREDKMSPSSTPAMTHAGNAVVDNPRRIYTAIQLAGLSLSLFESGRDDPLLRLTTEETRILSELYPNGEKLSTTISMKNLVCLDERLKAASRQHRSLIYQGDDDADGPSNMVLLQYETGTSNGTNLKLAIGTPRVVFIPDAVSDTLKFFSTDDSESVQIPSKDESQSQTFIPFVAVKDQLADEEIEAMYVTAEDRQQKLSSFSVSLSTSDCYLILVDLGSASLVASETSMVESTTETLVVKGVFDFQMQCMLDDTKNIVSNDAEFHGDSVEVFTAYGGNADAIQILEPSRLSVYGSSKIDDSAVHVIDVRAAAVTPLDLCVSMKNIALLNAIVSGITDCFEEELRGGSQGNAAISQKDAEHIEYLAAMLESDEVSLDSTAQDSASLGWPSGSSVAPPSSVAAMPEKSEQTKYRISCKLTLTEASITVVNDLQGIDDALFRVSFEKLVANLASENKVYDHRLSEPFSTFSGTINCSIMSDYFDDSSRTWKNLLLKPWEITARAQRGMNSRLSARIPSTTLDIESFACQLSFTEQFLVSLASANRMWAVYSTAITTALDSTSHDIKTDRLRRAVMASAARTLVTVLPYVIENHSGRDVDFVVHAGCKTKSICANGTMEYFRFPPPKGSGSGGKRLYGQDRTSSNSLTIFLEDFAIELSDIDSMIGNARQAHLLPTDEVIFSHIVKEGKAVVIHLSSTVDIDNSCSLPFEISLKQSKILSRTKAESTAFVGTSQVKQRRQKSSIRCLASVRKDGRMTKRSNSMGLPVEYLKELNAEWTTFGKCTLNFSISPEIPNRSDPTPGKLVGAVEINLREDMFHATHSSITTSFDVKCQLQSENVEVLDAFVAQVEVTAALVRGMPFIKICIAPRALIYNRIPLSMSVRTPMPHTFSEIQDLSQKDSYDIHHVAPGNSIEIYTPGPSIAVSLRCTDNPVAGSSTDWMEGGWVDLPLLSEFRLPEPFFVFLPFPNGSSNETTPRRGGTEVVIADKFSPHWDPAFYEPGSDAETEAIEVSAAADREDWRTYFIGIRHYAVDHTGEVLFEEGSGPGIVRQNPSQSVSSPTSSLATRTTTIPLGGYRSEQHSGRITLLPLGRKKIRLMHLTMEGEAGYKVSAPFLVEDIAVCEGGVEATSIPWESGDASGFFAYRQLVDDYQSELHVIPEYVVYNGSKTRTVRVKQPGHGEVTVLPGKIGRLRSTHNTRVAMSIEFDGFGGGTSPMNIDTAALRFAVVRSLDGYPIGSVAIETVVGSLDSRWVVKLSDLKMGSSQIFESKGHSILENDLLRFRIQWTELRITLSETRKIGDKGEIPSQAASQTTSIIHPGSYRIAPQKSRIEADTNIEVRQSMIRKSSQTETSEPVCTILFYRFTVDWQRVFKEAQNQVGDGGIGRAKSSPERSQISLIVHDVQMRDETIGGIYPVVFDATTRASFFDLCIRTRGPLSAELVDVSLFDLNLSCTSNKPEPIEIKITEDFVWRLLDLANNIVEAASAFAGYNIVVEYDEEHDGYVAEVSTHKASFIEAEARYTPPSSTTLYDFEKVRVSPLLLVVTFDRTPQKSRYEKKKHVRGGQLMNYFTRQLKFKIDQAELHFTKFQATNIKGGLDRLLELLSTAYTSRLKFKILSILTSATFKDWKNMASRQEGDDEYLEGDIMRITGNLAGRSADFIFKKAGLGLGGGIRFATKKVGDGFESAAGAVGARKLGTGVNHIVSGVGQGVGETVTGFGAGAGKMLMGAGLGVGQVFGGVGGGVLQVGKGIERGLQGDGEAFRKSISAGVTSVGKGVGDGVGSVVGGAADGVTALGKGFFSGVKSIGKGFGSAVKGKSKKKRDDQP